MRIVYFTHSLISCWNHGNAHFQRGVLRELASRSHSVRTLEPGDGWSRRNLLRDHGEAPMRAFASDFPDLRAETYASIAEAADAAHAADVAIVHEWNDPTLIAALGRERLHGDFLLLFHDTHHRAVSDPDAIRKFDLSACDGILAFGEALAEVYRKWGWGSRVFVWHEAADTQLFQPPNGEWDRRGLVWIGNWGDDERSSELEEFLLRPAREARLPLDVYGVRYPPEAQAALAAHGAAYRGWVANARVPEIFARHLATVHVPRRLYVERLPGIPTIRVFEALACGMPLLCAPWRDSEGLFRAGEDYLPVKNGAEMGTRLQQIGHDAELRASLSAKGLETIRARHSCAHRAEELLGIVARIGVPTRQAA
jgi:spore maturation protein CgeB